MILDGDCDQFAHVAILDDRVANVANGVSVVCLSFCAEPREGRFTSVDGVMNRVFAYVHTDDFHFVSSNLGISPLNVARWKVRLTCAPALCSVVVAGSAFGLLRLVFCFLNFRRVSPPCCLLLHRYPPSAARFALRVYAGVAFCCRVQPAGLFFLAVSVLVLSISSEASLFRRLFCVSLMSVSGRVWVRGGRFSLCAQRVTGCRASFLLFLVFFGLAEVTWALPSHPIRQGGRVER